MGTEVQKWKITRKSFSDELKMVAVSVSQYLLPVASLMMVGHLGQLQLSSTAIATALTNISGFSLLSGLVGGLETLCGQAYGAKQYHKLSMYTYSAIISLALVSAPISASWIFMDKLLVLVGQERSISVEAKRYSIWLIPALFGGSIQKPLVRYLQTQSLTSPLLFISLASLCFHIPVCWAMVFKFGFGNRGAAMAFSLSNWLYVTLLAMYVAFSRSCEKCRARFSLESFRVIEQFFSLALPSSVMVCLKWWSLEILVLLVDCCLIQNSRHLCSRYAYGLGAAASTQVSNELGAGNPNKARLSVWATMFVAMVESLAVSIALFSCRRYVGRAYSKEKQVVDYVAAMAIFLCLSIVTDSFQAIISGIARGSGWQHIGAYVNLGAFYLIGVPVSLILGFVVHMKAKGFWIGIVVGSFVQCVVLSIITCFTDWKKQARKAKERISGNMESLEN